MHDRNNQPSTHCAKFHTQLHFQQKCNYFCFVIFPPLNWPSLESVAGKPYKGQQTNNISECKRGWGRGEEWSTPRNGSSLCTETLWSLHVISLSLCVQVTVTVATPVTTKPRTVAYVMSGAEDRGPGKGKGQSSTNTDIKRKHGV